MKYADMKNPPESIRLHLDWWGQCRTCQYWAGDRSNVLSAGKCARITSSRCLSLTQTDTSCQQWESYDIDAAILLLDEWYENDE